MGHWKRPGAGRWIAVAALFAAGCANGSEAVDGTIETSRVVENSKIDFSAHPSHAERFGLVGNSKVRSQASAHEPSKALFAWKTPPGWVELPA